MLERIKSFIWGIVHHDSILDQATDSLDFIKDMLKYESRDMDFILKQISQIREILEGKAPQSDISDIPYLLDEIELKVEEQKEDARDLLADEVIFTKDMLSFIKFK